MKKLVLALSMAASLALISCSSSSKEEVGSKDSTITVVDTTKVDTSFVPATTSTVTVDSTKK